MKPLRSFAEAELAPVVEKLPNGLGTPLGEGGARVSGGEGQRVRIGRALLKRQARLVLLDEPFRGLPRATAVWPRFTWCFNPVGAESGRDVEARIQRLVANRGGARDGALRSRKVGAE